MAIGVVGVELGPYRLVRELGRGGMGEVWVAEHVAIRSRVAIKLLAPDKDNPDTLERFLREAKATARIRHPGIVTVSDFGTQPDGGAYIVMELLHGESLAQRLARGRVTPEVACELGVQIAEALAAAHEASVVHRDLKPGNIFLVEDAAVRGGWRVKLLDFGVAKSTSKVTDELGLTVTGALIGTPLYMAPEQCATRLGPVDARADLYALGIVLYEMVTGEPPFKGPTFGDLIDQHIHEMPRAPRTLADIPPALDALIVELLAKKREDRPPNARVVARRLAGEPVPSGEIAAARASASISAPLAETAAATPDPRLAKAAPVTPVPRPRRRWLAAIPAVIVAGVAIVLLATRGHADDIRTCETGDGAACKVLAAGYLSDRKPDLASVFTTLSRACELGDPPGCRALGDAFRDGVGTHIKSDAAVTSYTRACSAGDGRGCTRLADQQRTGTGTPEDRSAARANANLGCALGDAGGCALFGELVSFDLDGGDETAGRPWFELASQRAEAACRDNDTEGCLVHADLVAGGWLGSSDAARAFADHDLACKYGNAMGCALVSQDQMLGAGTVTDHKAALDHASSACDHGAPLGCFNLVQILLETSDERDDAQARDIAERECEQRGDEQCYLVVTLAMFGRGMPKDLEKARQLAHRSCVAGRSIGCFDEVVVKNNTADDDDLVRLRRMCQGGDPADCDMLGDQLTKRHDAANALSAFRVACAMSGGSYGCGNLGQRYLDGQGVPRDRERGIALFDKACAAHDGTGCFRYARRLVKGDGLPADPRRAVELLEPLCRGGFITACTGAATLLDGEHQLPADPTRAAALRRRACELDPQQCETKP